MKFGLSFWVGRRRLASVWIAGLILASQPLAAIEPPRLSPQSLVGKDTVRSFAALESSVSAALAGHAGNAGPESLRAAREEFLAYDLLLRDELEQAEEVIDRLGLGGDFRDRLEAARTAYLALSNEIGRGVDSGLQAWEQDGGREVPAGARAGLKDVERLFEESAAGSVTPILRASVLPYRRLSLPARPPRREPVVVPSYATSIEVPSAPEDLAPTPEAPLAPEIVAKAAALDFEYPRIYEFVRNEIETEWYAGSIKGALGTLRSGSGNDVDQASLLIALFRAASLPVRYVRGVAEIPIGRFAQELGLEQPSAIAAFLSRSGVPHEPLVRGGAVAGFEVETTWVTAHVPYSNYRGAVVDFSGRTWVPLAPAFKGHERRASPRVLDLMGFDSGVFVAAYLAFPRSDDPLGVLRGQVAAFLTQNAPAETFEDQLATRRVLARTPGLVPNTLPFAVSSVTAESAMLRDGDRAGLGLRIRAGLEETSATLLEHSEILSQAAGRRLTLSYIPATVEDHRLINAYGGLELVPAYLVRLRPQIKIAGRQVAISEGSLEMGVAHRLEVVLETSAGAETVDFTLVSGGYASLASAAPGEVFEPLSEDDPGDTEYRAARLLAGLAYDYAARWDAAEAELAALMDVAVARPLPSLVMATSSVKADIVLGLRQRLRWQGVTLDAALRVAEPVARGDRPGVAADWMRLSALQGSAEEYRIFEENFLVEAISADKGLALASASGVEVLAIDAANVADRLPLLSHPQEVKAEIEAWALAGHLVEVPRHPILVDEWRGSLWRVEQAATGAAGYFLTGGLAGGATTRSLPNWIVQALAEAFAAPLAPAPNLDPLAGVRMFKIPGTDGQLGEVGKKFGDPLMVLVVDEANRPVKGAQVLFTSLAGGVFVGEDGAESAILTAETNHLGVAAALLRSGERTAENPVFVERDPFDLFSTRALSNLVEAVGQSAAGPLFTDGPFELIAMPGPPATLRRTDTAETDFLGRHGLWTDTLLMVVEDAFGNPIANVDLAFEVGPMTHAEVCSNPPVNARNAVVFDSRVDGSGNRPGCPVPQPVLGDCGSPALILVTRSRGNAAVGVILGDSSASVYRVAVRVPENPDIAPLEFGYGTTFFQDAATQECDARGGLIYRVAGNLVNEQGEPINAAKAFGAFRQPVEVTMFNSFSGYEIAGESGAFTLIRLDASAGARGSWVPARVDRPETFQFSVSNGGSMQAVEQIGSGAFRGTVFTGSTPGINEVSMAAGEVLDNWLDVDAVTGELRVVPCEQFCLTRSLSGPVSEVFGVEPTILAVDPPQVALTTDGRSTLATRIDYQIEPLVYRGLGVSVDLRENESPIAFLNGTSRGGVGSATLNRGFALDVTRRYDVGVVVNRGSVVEVRAEPFPLPVGQQLFRSFTRNLRVSREVDLLNQQACSQGTAFEFSLTRAASVNLVFRRIASQGIDGSPAFGQSFRLIPDQAFEQGDHQISVGPGDLPPGDYVFELSGSALNPSIDELHGGKAFSENRVRDSLPVGHLVIKGVDLWDGHLSLSREDFAYPGRGVPLAFGRTYSSNGGKAPGRLGLGWVHAYESRIVVTECGEVIVIGGEGSGTRFVADGAGGFRALKGNHGSLVFDGDASAFDFYSKNGNRWHYGRRSENEFQLKLIEDANGNFTDLIYGSGDESGPRLIAVRDPSGRQLVFEYVSHAFPLSTGEPASDALDVVSRVEGPGGLSVSFTYDELGNLIRAEREDGHRVELYEYEIQPASVFGVRPALARTIDGLNGAATAYRYSVGEITATPEAQVNSLFVTSVTEPEGGMTGFVFDVDQLSTRSAFEVVTRVTDRRSKTTTYRMDQYGSPLAIEDPLGQVTRMTWTPDDVLITSRTDANGMLTTFDYDEHGNLLSETVEVEDFDGTPHTYTAAMSYVPPASFDPPFIKTKVASRTDRNGVTKTFSYDLQGNLVEEEVTVHGIDGAAQILVTAHTYLSDGDRASTIDPRGNRTHFSYDFRGNLAEIRDPLGGTTRTIWEDRSLPVELVDARGERTVFAYDGLGRLISTTHPAVLGQGPAVETVVYDDIINRRTATDAEGRQTVTDFDLEGRPVKIVDPAGAQKVLAYDAGGNKIVESTFFDDQTPRLDTVLTYDDAGRLVRRDEPEGRATSLVYDAVGNVIRETLSAPQGVGFEPRVAERGYDALNRPIRFARALGPAFVETLIKVDGEGNKLLERDPLGRETVTTFDEVNRPIRRREPEGRTTLLSYDGNGNLIAETLLNEVDGVEQNQVRTRVYDALDRPIQAMDAEGGVRLFDYDAVGNLLREVDPNVDAVSQVYDARNRRIRSTVHLGRVTQPSREVVTRFVYDRVGNLLEERRPNGNVLGHTYDDLDRLTASVDSLGPLGSFAYDARGNRIEGLDAAGERTVTVHDGLDRPVRQELPEERTVLRTYDVAGNALSETDPRGSRTDFTYDSLDRLVVTTAPAPFRYESSTLYDAAGNRLSETDRRGKTKSFVYDGLNRPIRTTGPPPSSLVTTVVYDTAGNRLRETDRRGIATEMSYDRENRLLRTVRDGLLIEESAYDAAGNRVTAWDANRHRTDFEVDERDLLIAELRPLGSVTRHTLDDEGDRVRTVDPEGRVRVRVFDARRRLTSESNGAGETTLSGYDPKGNRMSLKRPEENEWTFVYDGADRLTEVRDPLLNLTLYTYDRNGNRLSQTDAEGRTTLFEYDELDRRTALQYVDGARETAVYDENDNLTVSTDAKAQVTTRVYDELDRETLRSFSGGPVGPGESIESIATTYDANGNPLQVTETYPGAEVFTTVRSWDRLDRLSSVTDRFGETLTYSYDANGNRTRLTDADGRVTLYAYDALNRPQSVTTEAGATTHEWLKNGLLKKVTYPNGVTASQGYDPANRVTSIENRLGTALVSSFAYAYDRNGNRIEQVEDQGQGPETTTYTYDTADRLVEAAYPDKTVTHTYDGVGNRLTEIETAGPATLSSKTLSYDTRHRLFGITLAGDPAAATTYAYDPNGNQTGRTRAGVTQGYVYDVRDRLVEVQQGGILLEAYQYDAQGLRVRKSGPGGILRYTYDDQSVLLQSDDFGGTVAKYDYGADRLVSLDHATEGRQFYLFDALGSVANLVGPGGALEARYQYDAWGNPRATTGTSPNPFSFTGHERDDETGLYYFKARFYDPEIGRFLREDPFEGTADNPPSLHRYLYAFGNPTVFVDPTGEIGVIKALQTVFEAGETVLESLVTKFSESSMGQTTAGQVVATKAVQVAGVAAGSLEIAADVTGQANNVVNLALVGLLAREDIRLGQLTDEAVAEFTDQIRNAVDLTFAAQEVAQMIEEDPKGAGVKFGVTLIKKGVDAAVFLDEFGDEEPSAVFQASKQAPKLAAAVATAGILGRAQATKRAQEGLEEVVEDLAVLARGPAQGTRGTAFLDPVRTLPVSRRVPNAGGVIRSFVTEQDQIFFRVFSGESQTGGFLVRIRPGSRAKAIEGLALPPGNEAQFIQEVLVPAGARLQRSRALPAFGRRGGLEQFELLHEIPAENFAPGVRFQ